MDFLRTNLAARGYDRDGQRLNLLPQRLYFGAGNGPRYGFGFLGASAPKIITAGARFSVTVNSVCGGH